MLAAAAVRATRERRYASLGLHRAPALWLCHHVWLRRSRRQLCLRLWPGLWHSVRRWYAPRAAVHATPAAAGAAGVVLHGWPAPPQACMVTCRRRSWRLGGVRRRGGSAGGDWSHGSRGRRRRRCCDVRWRRRPATAQLRAAVCARRRQQRCAVPGYVIRRSVGPLTMPNRLGWVLPG